MAEEIGNQTSSTAAEELTVRLTLHRLTTNEAEMIALYANEIAGRNLTTDMHVEIFRKEPPLECNCGMYKALGVRCGVCPLLDLKVGE